MKIVLVFFSLIASFALGAFFGDRIGLDNRTYYDAPGKIKILSSVLDQEKSEDWVQGEITKQIRILNESEITPNKNYFFLYFMENGDIFDSEYEKYISDVKGTKRYREAISLLCKYNEIYEGKCKENL